MDLRSDYPYWLLRQGIIRSYPSLSHHTTTDIVIMGGGISGALSAWYLVNAGFKVILVDRRHIGMGSTAASTALLQYEIDVPLRELIDKVGEKNAVRSYHLCREAIHTIGTISHKLIQKGNFRYKPSFQYASYKKDRKDLEKEFQLRKKAGFSLHWMNEKDIRDNYGFSSAGGILSGDGAEVDAYQFTHALLEKCIAKGLQVYDHTEIIKINHHKRSVELLTSANKKIKARKLVIACGYESQRYIPKKVQDLRSTYAIISEPHEQKEFWYKNSLIWETKDPYLYIRTTADNRVIIGGKDSDFSDPAKRDKLLAAKARALEGSFTDLFPSIPFRTDFKWAGSFASTKDGLPYIGSIPQRPHTYFALGLGGNGITFSVIAAEILRDIFKGRKNEDADIFAFDR
ncbi:MAG: FAD-dependent oxidoreductase [Bacteroidota bacterium]